MKTREQIEQKIEELDNRYWSLAKTRQGLIDSFERGCIVYKRAEETLVRIEDLQAQMNDVMREKQMLKWVLEA